MSEEWIGKTISKVTLERRIGRGGMAEVYLGRHTTLDRPVAVKILHAHLAENPQLLGRIQAEAKAVAGLRHPNIVQVYDFDVVEGRPYIVMELLKGLTLADFNKAHRRAGFSLPTSTISEVISGLAGALDYAHQRGIIHRDVKPANVMLRQGETPLRPDLPLPQDAQPILTDFGVARIAHATTHTEAGTVLGTAHYMSPEQIQGGSIDHRADIYALGIIAYEMLTGAVPFDPEADTPAPVLYKQVHEPPPPMPDTEEGLQRVVLKALAKQVDQRYDSAGQFARELKGAIGEGAGVAPTMAGEPAAAPRRGRPTRRRWLLWGLLGGGAAVTLLAALLGAAFLTGFLEEGIPGLTAGQTPVPAGATSPGAVESGANPTPLPGPSTSLRGDLLLEGTAGVLTITQLQAPGLDGLRLVLGGPDRTPLELGTLEGASGGRLEFDYSGEGYLAGSFDRLLVYPAEQIEPEGAPLLEIALDPQAFQRFRLLAEVHPGEDLTSALLDGLAAQVRHYDSHLGFSVEGIRAGELAPGQTHAEHTVNILVGQLSEDYGDWDGNGRVENPGDEVGLIPYLQILADLLSGPMTSPEADQRQEAADLLDQVNRLGERAAEADRIALQIALADSLDVIQDLGLADQLAALTLTGSVDAVVERDRPLNLAYRVIIEP